MTDASKSFTQCKIQLPVASVLSQALNILYSIFSSEDSGSNKEHGKQDLVSDLCMCGGFPSGSVVKNSLQIGEMQVPVS